MTDSLLHKRAAEAQGLETAVVLAAPEPSRAALSGTSGGVGPLTRVGGLTLFQRALLTLQRAGIGRALVLVGDEEAALKDLLRADPRVHLAVRWLPMREFPPDDPQTWEAVLAELQGYCLVVEAQTLFSRDLVERLRREVRDGRPSLLLCRATEPGPADASADLIVLRTGPFTAPRPAGPTTAGREPRPPADPGALRTERALWLRGLIRRAADEGGLRTLALPPDSACWVRRLGGPADVRQVERKLLRTLKGQFEGVVDRYVNRKLSAWFTRLFLRAGLSANAVTVLSMLIGLLSASAIAHGTYLAGVVGALLFQLAAIVDCCDGEIARLTFTESTFGERLDLLGDNVVHIAVFAGIAWAGFLQQGGWQGGAAARLPLWLGLAAGLGNLLSLGVVMRAKTLRDRGAFIGAATAARVDFILKHMASRDFSMLVLIFALLGRLDVFLWLAALGANAFWVILAWVTRPSATVRA